MTFGLIIEVVVAALLVITASYCFVLDRKLNALRTGRDGLRDLVKALNSSTERAQSSIVMLRATADEAGARLEATVSEAKRLSEELTMMTDAGDRVAERLSSAVDDQRAARTGRPQETSTSQTAPAPQERDASDEPATVQFADLEARAKNEASHEMLQDEDWQERVRDKILGALGGVR